MDAKFKTPWVKALRSGVYKQGIETFESAGRYCCLGVLLQINEVDTCPGLSFERIEKRFGVTFQDCVDLADINDSGATFDQIALCIENGL